jgi:hypothetical protein
VESCAQDRKWITSRASINASTSWPSVWVPSVHGYSEQGSGQKPCQNQTTPGQGHQSGANKDEPEAVACIVATPFSVLCVEKNMRISRSAPVRLARSVSSCTSCPALVSKPAISKPNQDSSGPRSNAVQPTKFQRIRQDPRYADLLKKYACRHKAIKRAKHEPNTQDGKTVRV